MEQVSMKIVVRRLIAAVLALAVAVVMMFSMMYAWVTLSSAPEVGGLKISLSTGGTIMIAANKTVTVDGVTYNYPATFFPTLDFNHYSEYGYLKDLSILSPVSTADGLHWFIPDYYDVFDEEVTNGEAMVGQVKPAEEFFLDTYMQYSNLTGADNQTAADGSYVYLDFWVVSPMDDCELRVASDDSDSGSFALEIKAPVENEGGGYSLAETSGDLASSVRIGFLVNSVYASDGVADAYGESIHYNAEYANLKGDYQEKGGNFLYSDGYSFCVYEPNADLHPNLEDGAYYPTYPIAWNGEKAYVSDTVGDNLTVQLRNLWKNVEGEALIDRQFDIALLNREVNSEEEARGVLYDTVLCNGAGGYVERGRFIKNVGALASFLDDGVVSSEEMSSVEKTGATHDSCITILEKNCPQRIRMFVWIEGTDVDCTDLRGSLDLSLSLELAGSNQGLYEKTKQDNNR